MADAIIALTALSALLASVMGLNSSSLDASQKASTRLTATLIAKAVLEDRSIRDNQGSFTVDGTAYSWTRISAPKTSRSLSVVQISDITITVNWQVKSGQNQVSLQTSRWQARNEG